ncbi:MAG: ATP-binding protein [Candidatus Nanoarchaeia archaeon]
MIPRLVVLTGYPCAGKSRFSEYFRNQGYVKISTDDIRESFLGCEDRETYQKDQNIKEKESLVWQVVGDAKYRALSLGFNVIIDSTAMNREARKQLLHTMIPEGEVEKHLVYVHTLRSVLEERAAIKYEKPDLEYWDKHWQAPGRGAGYSFHILFNNTEEDYQFAIENLETALKR